MATDFDLIVRRQMIQNLHQGLVFCRFREMSVEPGFLSTLAIHLLSPARQSDQKHMLSPRLLADYARAVIAVEFRHGNIEHGHVRMKLSGGIDGWQKAGLPLAPKEDAS